MNTNNIMQKLTGRRFNCASGCCNAGVEEKKYDDFDLVYCIRLAVGVLVFAAALLFGGKMPAVWKTVLLIVSTAVAGADLVASSVMAITNRRYFDKEILVTAVAVLAFFFRRGVDAAAMVILYQLGSLFVEYAFLRTKETVLEDTFGEPMFATVLQDGAEAEIMAGEIKAGDTVLVHVGQRVPCDCVVKRGSARIDRSYIGGGVVSVAEGDEVLAGSMNMDGDLTCEAIAAYEESVIAVLKKRVGSTGNAGTSNTGIPAKLSTYYTPAVLILAILVLAISQLVLKASFVDSVGRALSVVLIGIPCALFISAPLVRFVGTASAAVQGIFFSNTNTVDKTASINTVVFDKSGTLTKGRLKVDSIKTERMPSNMLLKITAHAFAYSSSPLAKPIIDSYGETIYIELVDSFAETPGRGVEVRIESVHVCAGSAEFIAEKGVEIPEQDISAEQAVYVSIGSEYAGRLVFADSLRESSTSAINELHAAGVGKIVMFTDEPEITAAKTAALLDIKEYYCEYPPERRQRVLSELRNAQSDKSCTAYVSACESAEHSPADLDITMCDVSSLSSIGAELAITSGDPASLAAAVSKAKTIKRFSTLLFAAAALVKIILLVMALYGVTTLWFTVTIDAVSTIGTILAAGYVYGDFPDKNSGDPLEE